MKLLKLAAVCLALLKPVRAAEECAPVTETAPKKVFTWVVPTESHVARMAKNEAGAYVLLAPGDCDGTNFLNILNQVDWKNFHVYIDKKSQEFKTTLDIFKSKGFLSGFSRLEYLKPDEANILLQAIKSLVDLTAQAKSPCNTQKEQKAAQDFLQYLLSQEAKKIVVLS